MEKTLRQIITKASKLKPEYGDYKNHTPDPFTQGINIKTTTDYTLGVSKELISDFEKGLIDEKMIVNRLKIKKEPKE